MRWIAGIAFGLILLLVLGSFLPLVPADAWWVRYWDYPRVQIGYLLIVLLAIHLIASKRDAPRILAAVLVLAALAAHAVKLLPFTTVAPPVARVVGECAPGNDLRLLSFNVQRSNEVGEALIRLVAETEPDLILLMETDEDTGPALAPLRADFPYMVQHVPEDARYYGMHLLSRLPLVSPEVTLGFGPETPSIVTGVRLPSGELVRFQGLHPRPPVLFERGTTLRDATLYRAALDAASSPRPSILAGDFNAVPWEAATTRVMRLGGLLEPRVGRGIFVTYGAESLWRGWPLDYVVYQDGFGLLEYRLLPNIGSDHRPVLTQLCLDRDLADVQAAPAAQPEDIRAAEDTFARAARRQAEEAGP